MDDIKQINDSKDNKRGDFYQALVSLKYALSDEYRKFKLLTFEHLGDITFDSSVQIECKHSKNKQTLSDTSEDFWKTLYNWIRLKKKFNKYILHTTDHFPKQKNTVSQLSRWCKSSQDQRWDILHNIKFNYDLDEISNYKIFDRNLEIISNLNLSKTILESLKTKKNKQFNELEFNNILSVLDVPENDKITLIRELKDTSDKKYNAWNYSRYVLSCIKVEVLPLLENIAIETEQLNDDELLSDLVTYPTFEVLDRPIYEKIQIVKNIAGIINSKVEGNGRFEYTRGQLFKIIKQETNDFYNKEYRPIFDKYNNYIAPENLSEIYSNYKFFNELKQLQCENDELEDAVVDFWKTVTLLDEEETNSPGFTMKEYTPYKTEVHVKIKNRKRDFTKSSNYYENLDKSLKFYRSAKQIEVFGYKSIPNFEYFKHGTMQNIVEDTILNFSWIL